MPLPTTPYASDEDILTRAAGDYRQLCPKDQVFARGSDGAVATSDLWTVASATVPFAGYGVAAGMVCFLGGGGTPGATAPVGTPANRPFYPGDSEAFVVQAAGAGSMTLRRKGQPAGVGMPIAPPAGLASLSFTVVSLGPLLLHASYDMARRMGIDDAFVGRRTADLYDMQELVDATTWTLLARQYAAMARSAGDKGAGDDFWAKHKEATRCLDAILDRLALHWKPTVPGDSGPIQSTMRVGRLQRG